MTSSELSDFVSSVVLAASQVRAHWGSTIDAALLGDGASLRTWLGENVESSPDPLPMGPHGVIRGIRPVLGRRVLILEQDRAATPVAASFPARLCTELGVGRLIAMGVGRPVSDRIAAGDILVVEDHLNLTGQNPLVGPNIDRWGPRFPDMSHPYDGRLVRAARENGGRTGIWAAFGAEQARNGDAAERDRLSAMAVSLGADALGEGIAWTAITAAHGRLRFGALIDMRDGAGNVANTAGSSERSTGAAERPTGAAVRPTGAAVRPASSSRSPEIFAQAGRTVLLEAVVASD